MAGRVTERARSNGTQGVKKRGRWMKGPDKGDLFWRVVGTIAGMMDKNIPFYASYAGYFIFLAVFPMLLLLLTLLQYIGLRVDNLVQLLEQLLPQSAMDVFDDLIRATAQDATGTLVGASVLTALWSASKGVYGLLKGLNAVYRVSEDRGYFYTRTISVVYTFLFLVVLVLTLVLHVFGNTILSMVHISDLYLLRILMSIVDLRFLVLLAVQTLIFTLMFMVLPNRRNRFRDSLPGGLLSSLGWLVFSDLFSIYVENYSDYSSIYGSIYAVAISMLWLYFCISILFYGGALNRYLMEE